MCNGQCNGNCGKDKPKTVKELLKELNSDMPYDKFESVKEELVKAIEDEKVVRFNHIEQTQKEHTDLLHDIIKSQTSFWDNVGANVVGDALFELGTNNIFGKRA